MLEKLFILNLMILSMRQERLNSTVYKSAFYLVFRGRKGYFNCEFHVFKFAQGGKNSTLHKFHFNLVLRGWKGYLF